MHLQPMHYEDACRPEHLRSVDGGAGLLAIHLLPSMYNTWGDVTWAQMALDTVFTCCIALAKIWLTAFLVVVT